MEKVKRNERIAIMTRILVGSPNQSMGLSGFCQRFDAAKSSISEDIAIIDDALKSQGIGRVLTTAGAAGGVHFRPCGQPQDNLDFLSELADALSDPQRVLPGGYIYLSDVLSDPAVMRRMGEIIACAWQDIPIDFVLTMETKGIPLAMMASHAMGLPLIIARRQSKVYEGSAVNISYVSGKGSIESMSLSRRAVHAGQRTLIVDDFTRDGGTAGGLISLMHEFGIEVAGLSFMLAQSCPPRKPIEGEKSLLVFAGDGVEQPVRIRPAEWLSLPLRKG